MTEAIISNTPNPRIDANPDLVGLPGGRAALTWQAGRADGGFDIMLRLREADGTFGEATRLEAGGEARAPELARLSDDTVLVTWIAESGDGERSLVRAQRFDEEGAALSAPFEVASRPVDRGLFADARIEPDVDGGFAIYMRNVLPDGARYDWGDRYSSAIFASDVSVVPNVRPDDETIALPGPGTLSLRDFSASGSVDTYWSYGFFSDDVRASWVSHRLFRDGSITGLDDGGRLPGIDSIIQVLNEEAVLLVRNAFLPFGTEIGTGFGSDGVGRPSEMLALGAPYDLEEIEEDFSRSSEGAEISALFAHVARIDSTGDRPTISLGDPIYVPEDRSRLPEMQSFDAAALDDGGFVISWSTGQDVLAQRFDAEGSPVGDNFDVASGPPIQREASVTQLDGDTMLFAWQRLKNGNVEVITREVTLDEMAEGTYEVFERPYLYLEGDLIGPGRAGTTFRIEGGVETNYPLSDYSIRWQRAGSGDETFDWRDIEGANGLRYALDAGDVGSAIRLVASVESVTGLTDAIVLEYANRFGPLLIEPALLDATREVTVEGEASLGEVLTASATLTEPEGPLDGPVFFQWLRDGEPIAGAFDPAYAVTPEDVGADLSVEIRYAETDGTEGVLRSAPVEATALPSVAGSAGDDLLEGSAEAEAIFGGAGDDTLLAHGDDRLEGGPGSDVFAFAAGRIAGVAEIENFAPGDRIALDDALLGPGGADFDPRLADLPTLLGALGTGRLSWSPVDVGRTVWSLGLDPDGAGSDPLAEVARVTAAGGDALSLELSDVLLF